MGAGGGTLAHAADADTNSSFNESKGSEVDGDGGGGGGGKVRKTKSTSETEGIDLKPQMTEEEAKERGEALGKLFKKSGEKMKSHSALVFDCGTGETKAIYLKYYIKDDKARVETKELSKGPGTLEFLRRKPASENEDYKKKKKAVDTNIGKKGKPAFKNEEDREAARLALRDGFWFLNEKPADATDKLEPHQFVEFCVQTRNRLNDSGSKPDLVMIGCSAWARDAGELQDEADALVLALTKAGLVPKKLLQSQEGAFEAAAVGYAYTEMVPDGKTTGIIASGGGSVQFMHSNKYQVNLDCGNRMLRDAMAKTYDETQSVNEALKEVARFTSEKRSVSGLEGRIAGEIHQERGRACADYPDAKDVINGKLGGTVVAISACYYGAQSIDKGNADEMAKSYKCEDIIAEMKAKIAETEHNLKDGGRAADKGKRETDFFTIANLAMQIKLYEQLFTKDCQLCFKREWNLGGIKFRTTWTAGWYLNFLFDCNIHFAGSDPVLQAYADRQKQGLKELGLASDGLGEHGQGNEGVAMMLVDMKAVIKQMRAVALRIANPVDKFLQGVATEFGGELKGWPNFKIKTYGSLNRKLIGTIYELLSENVKLPSYTPNVEEVKDSIHDCLRYTLTFPPNRYRDAVLEIEKRLLTQQAGQAHQMASKIKFKNFWRDGENETVYQGINAQVTLMGVTDLGEGAEPVDTSKPKPEDDDGVYAIPKCQDGTIPNSDKFIFELQLHTPQSYKMKDGPGHLLYEKFRDPSVKGGTVGHKVYDGEVDLDERREFKKALYLMNKSLYATQKDDGTPLQKGMEVADGLFTVDHEHKWTNDPYKFEPYKPNPSMAKHECTEGVEGSDWRSLRNIDEGLEKELAEGK